MFQNVDTDPSIKEKKDKRTLEVPLECMCTYRTIQRKKADAELTRQKNMAGSNHNSFLLFQPIFIQLMGTRKMNRVSRPENVEMKNIRIRNTNIKNKLFINMLVTERERARDGLKKE